MSARILYSLTDKDLDLQKQIGCMSGIFQPFGCKYRSMDRRINSGNKKTLLLGPKHQLELHNATKKAVTEKDLKVQKEKPRVSKEPSRASNPSLSCSSAFSSRKANIAEQISLTKSQQSIDLRDIVKDAMHRQARGKSFKPQVNYERKGNEIKHIDSPRPLRFEKPNAPPGRTKNSKNELLTLPRFSYDERESRSKIKVKELPRFSLDSKAIKFSSAIESRSSHLGSLNREPGRSSSVVAKLMGLEAFPDSIARDGRRITNKKSSHEETSRSSSFRSESNRSQVSDFPRFSQISASPSPGLHNANSLRNKTRFSRRQEDSGQMSPNKTSCMSASVYGQMEKRITELEFEKSGKDLRALKQILDAMHKTRDAAEVVKPGSDVMDKIKTHVPKTDTQNLQRLQKRGDKYHLNSSEHSQKAQISALMNDRLKAPIRHLISINKTTTWRNSEMEQPLKSPQSTKVENCTTSGRSSRMGISRFQRNLKGGQSRPTTASSDSSRVKKHLSNKLEEKGPENRKQKVKSKSLQLIRRETSYQGETSSVKSELQIETSTLSLDHAINTNAGIQQNCLSSSREGKQAVELEKNMLEQPSPISVLDATFYSKHLPSPEKNTSTASRDESQCPDEAEWHLDNLNHLNDTQLISSCRLTNPNMFHVLEDIVEEGKGEPYEKNDKKELDAKVQRHIVLDMVNEILSLKITSSKLYTVRRQKTSLRGLMQEVHSEMARLRRMADCKFDTEDGINVVAGDMKHESEDWTDYRDEVPALVLDIERLVFKDLINEVVAGEITCLHDLPTEQHRATQYQVTYRP